MCIPLLMGTSSVTYALVAQERQYPLQSGKNVVGRSSIPVDGVSFINLESPLSAISRMQAFLDVAANGDAWISDCNSTNGTFLSIRPGPGIRLEANRYYQLTPGCRIVFGDVECTFEVLDSTLTTPVRSTASPVISTTRLSRKTERLDTTGTFKGASASKDAPEPRRDDAKSKAPVKESRRKSGSIDTHRGNVPYLDESTSLSQEHSNAPAAAASLAAAEETEGKKNNAEVEKRSKRSSPASSPSPAPAKRARKESTPHGSPTRAGTSAPSSAASSKSKSTNKSAGPPVVCLTGMDSDERTAIAKRVRQLKGRVVDDITKANLLVVAMPPVRTPKFIIAAARGIPIVSVNYICNDRAELEDARRHIVGLKTDQHTYTAAALEKVIYRKENRPLLQGVRVNVSALSSKTRAIATEIITASGGVVIHTKRGDALNVTDDQLDTLYDSILRGKVPQSL